MSDETDPTKIYSSKVKNVETGLQEFAKKQSVIKALPTKLTLQVFNFYNKQFLPIEIFLRLAQDLFPTVNFVDLRGIGDSSNPIYSLKLLEIIKKYPYINWHTVSHLRLNDEGFWKGAYDLGFIIGFVCEGVSDATISLCVEGVRMRTIKKNLQALRPSSHKENPKGHLYGITIIRKQNYQEIPEIISFLSENGIQEHQLKIIEEFRANDSDQVKDRELLIPVLNEAFERAMKCNIKLTLNDNDLLEKLDQNIVLEAGKYRHGYPVTPFPPNTKDVPDAAAWWSLNSTVTAKGRVAMAKKCFKPYHYGVVMSDGRVSACPHLMFPKLHELGDLNNKNFLEVWNSEKFQNFRKDLAEGKPTCDRCQWCFEYRTED